MNTTPFMSFRQWPCTFGVMAYAILFSAAFFAGNELSFAMADAGIWHGQFWRFLTSCLIHGDIFHLVFNLYWLVELGRPIESRYGSLRAGLLMVFLAAGSGAAQFLASGTGGIGLSGVGYGFFGLLWATRGNERGTGYLLANRTIGLFVGWFFLCLATTFVGVWKVGNIAHASGFVLGFLIGRSLVSGRPRIWVPAAILPAILLVVSTLYMPWSYLWWWERGSDALEHGAHDHSRQYWVRAVEKAADDHKVEPLLQALGHEAFNHEDYDQAIQYYRRAIRASDSPGIHRAYLAYALFAKDETDAAREVASGLQDSDLDSFLQGIPDFVAFVSQARAVAPITGFRKSGSQFNRQASSRPSIDAE